MGLLKCADQSTPAHVHYDNIYVRKYATIEPVATIGNETAIGISKSDAYGIGANATMAFTSLHGLSIDGAINDGWNYVVMTYDGSSYCLYINGNLATSQTLTGTIPTNLNNIFIKV